MSSNLRHWSAISFAVFASTLTPRFLKTKKNSWCFRQLTWGTPFVDRQQTAARMMVGKESI